MIPNLSRRIFGEGALTAALVPVYTQQLHDNKESAKLLVSSVVTLLVIILAGLTLLGLGAIFFYRQLISSQSDKTHLVLSLAAIMLPYMILICSTATLGAVLNVHRRFGVPAAAPIILNVCIIAGALCFRQYFGQTPWQQIYVIAVAVLIAGVLQLLIQIPALRSAGVSIRPRFYFKDEPLRKIFRLMAPMIVGLAAVQINTLLDMLIAYYLSATGDSGDTFMLFGHALDYPVVEGSVTYLFYAQRCYQLPLGVFGIALATAIFPVLSQFAAEKDYKGFAETFAHGLRMVIFIGVPASAGLILVREPLVELLFERGKFTPTDSLETSATLLFYSFGIVGFFLQQLVVRGYYSFQDSLTPVRVAVRMIVLNFILNLILIWPLGTGGLGLSTAICAFLQVGILLTILIKRYRLNISDGLIVTSIKTVTATVIMSIGGYLTISALAGTSAWVQLPTGVVVCLVLYLGVALVMKNREMIDLLRRR